MTELVHNRRVFVTAVLCGLIISIIIYMFPLESGPAQGGQNSSPLLWPVALLLVSFQLAPRLFVARIIWEALGAPEMLGHAFTYLYWPVIGAFIGRTKHYLSWALGLVLLHLVLTSSILYILSKAKFTF